METGIRIFASYSHEDERLWMILAEHMSPLRKHGLIADCYDHRISPGKEWAHEIDAHLKMADLILLLVSRNFVASEYCYGVEMKRAMERHEAGEARVVPIILRPVDWEYTPFGKLQALPRDGKAVTTWQNRDQAFVDIAKGIRKALKDLISIKLDNPSSNDMTLLTH